MSSTGAPRLVDLRHDMVQTPALRSGVRGFVTVGVAGAGVLALRTIPHSSLVLSFQCGTDLVSREHGGVRSFSHALTGLRRRVVDYHAAPGTRTWVALLSPAFAFALLGGLAPAELTDTRVALEDVLPPSIWHALEERLRCAEPRGSFGLFETWLLARVRGRPRAAPREALRAFSALERVRSGLARTIQGLAHDLDVSRRQLERDCARWLAVSPKQLFDARRLRMSLEQLHRGAALAATATDVGFFDQSHMTHSFRRHLVGSPKTQALARLSPLGQAYRCASGELVTL